MQKVFLINHTISSIVQTPHTLIGNLRPAHDKWPTNEYLATIHLHEDHLPILFWNI
jgi:hypothetical protein